MNGEINNKMEEYLGEQYSKNNHLLNWINYWIKNNNRNHSEKWRLENDLDCLYLGDLRADTIVSMYSIFSRVARCINGNNICINKTNELLSKMSSKNNLNQVLPPEDSLVKSLQELAFLAELECNYMLLPNRQMQKRGFYYADEMPPTLYQCFDSGKFACFFNSFDELEQWVCEQRLKILFINGEIKKENIIPITKEFPTHKSMKRTKRRDLLHDLIKYDIKLLQERSKIQSK